MKFRLRWKHEEEFGIKLDLGELSLIELVVLIKTKYNNNMPISKITTEVENGIDYIILHHE